MSLDGELPVKCKRYFCLDCRRWVNYRPCQNCRITKGIAADDEFRAIAREAAEVKGKPGE